MTIGDAFRKMERLKAQQRVLQSSYDTYHRNFRTHCEPYMKEAYKFTQNEFELLKLEKLTQGHKNPNEKLPSGVADGKTLTKFDRERIEALHKFNSLSKEDQAKLLNMAQQAKGA